MCIVVVVPRTAWSRGICAGHKKHIDRSAADNSLNDTGHCHRDGHSLWRLYNTGSAVAQNQVGQLLSCLCQQSGGLSQAGVCHRVCMLHAPSSKLVHFRVLFTIEH